jgi:hypothetical protein
VLFVVSVSGPQPIDEGQRPSVRRNRQFATSGKRSFRAGGPAEVKSIPRLVLVWLDPAQLEPTLLGPSSN